MPVRMHDVYDLLSQELLLHAAGDSQPCIAINCCWRDKTQSVSLALLLQLLLLLLLQA